MVVGDGHRLYDVLELVVEGFLVGKLGPIEDVDVDPPILLG